ncbi:hypothetical protein DNTS_016707 [Danionella cerebrum]|uniref:GCF C-terminal domain-containing protein n=1 Tax=Danionella cerebrum TaxID=2873325 RepID=A0A553QEG8_9TELE|nr:hypothetical protein DNTS_016707 [Danionella translucida]
MFNKKPRRNFRQRKNNSSDEDVREKITRDESRKEGLRTSKAPECLSSEDDEPSVTTMQPKDRKQQVFERKNLSFCDEKDSTEGSFQIKRSARKEVVFQARKKDDSPVPSPSLPVEKNKDVNVSDSDGEEASDEVLPASDGDDDDKEDTSSTMSSSSASSHPQREQRKKARAQQEYISLDSPRTPGSLKDDHLSNEEQDSDNQLDDHERRIEFAPKPRTLRERMAEKMAGSDDDDDESVPDSQEEEDQQMWEEQQIGKGVKRHQKGFQESRVRQKKMEIPATLPAASIDVIKKRITGKLDSLREVHRAREAELRKMQLDLEMAKSASENLERHSADEQLRFYRSMNVFSQNLLECLSEKMAGINSTELEMHTLYIDQAEALLSRRREALQQESSQIQKLTYNSGSHSNGDTTGGSNPNQQSLSEGDIGCEPCDWEPTAEQCTELRRKRDDLLKQAQMVFADVQTEFWDVKKILSRFDEWRVSFPESYTNAYVGLCLPKLLAPLIRHQLIGWNPLQAGAEDFEAFPWYSAVEHFCHGQGYEELENMDRTTLPSIIEKTILPKVQGFVELVWDPLSTQQSQTLTALCRKIQDDYSVFEGDQSKPVKGFVEAVIQRLQSSVNDDVYIPIYPKKFLEDKHSQQFQFQNKQFWSAVKLLGNMALWDGLVPEQILKELMLEKLLGRYLMMNILNDPDPKHTVQKCKKIADFFPESWFVDSYYGASLPQLLNLSKHLLQTIHAIFKDNSDSRSLLSDVLSVLKKIDANDSIRILMEKYDCDDLVNALQ